MRKRTKRKVRPLINPLDYVLIGLKPLTAAKSANVDLRLKNRIALEALAKGEAVQHDMDMLIASMNISNALRMLGIGRDEEYDKLQDEAIAAISAVRDRGERTGRCVCTGPELTAIKLMFEFHDAQLDITPIYQLDKANKMVAAMEHKLRSQNGTKKKARSTGDEVHNPSSSREDRNDQTDSRRVPHEQT